MTKKYYDNKNGHLTVEELVKLIHTGKIDPFLRGFSTIKYPCPPKHFITANPGWFYCISCYRDSLSRVKEYKDYYKVGKKKYMKSDLEEESND